MSHDLLERLSQDFYREENEGDSRNAEVARWLCRSCTPGTPEYDRTELLVSPHKLVGLEDRAAEDYAIAHQLWFDDDRTLGLVGPCGDENNFKQEMITGTINAAPEEIAAYMTALGFQPDNDYGKPAAWRNDKHLIWDLLPKNVLKDRDGNLYVIDAEIRKTEENM